ncbi:MAG: hypothetical protein PVF15_08620 [Candidatus Bathyarchaeota archaeon]
MRTNKVASLFLAASGSIILVWIAWLTWYDMTSWGKDITLIFFESRTGQTISLGVDMKVIHYFLISLILILSSLPMLCLNRGYRLHFPRFLRFFDAPLLRKSIETLTHHLSRFIAGIVAMVLLGLCLFISPFRGETLAIVGVYALLSTLIITLLATAEFQVENYDVQEYHMEETMYRIVDNTAKAFDISRTGMDLRKTDEFEREIYLSEGQTSLSSNAHVYM